MLPYRGLDTETLERRDDLHVVEGSPRKSLTDPACDVIFDFYRQPPLRLSPGLAVEAAIARLQRTRLIQAIIEDAEGNFCGLVTLADLESRKVLGGDHEPEGHWSTLDEVMITRESLKGVEYSTLQHATIGDLLQTLKAEGTFVLLVMDGDNIRGLIMASEVARCLDSSSLSVDVPVDTSRHNVIDVISGR